MPLLFVIAATAVLGAVGFVTLLVLTPKRPRPLSKKESIFLTPTVPEPVSSLLDKPSVDFTLVIPAYNESKRIPRMLDAAIEYLEKRRKKENWTYEIIVVDDHSRDKTAEAVIEYSKKTGVPIRVLQLEVNRGKGGAVRLGVMCSRGRYILFADADGATQFSDVHLLEQEAKKMEKKGLTVAAGSRSHLVNTEAVVKRSFIRNLLMHIFHQFVYIFGVRGIQDTQCGFKYFSRDAARTIFPNLHLEGWIFDVEVLLLARYAGIPVAEVPVNWTEIEGSKLSVATDSVKMARDLVMIRFYYSMGIWQKPSRSLENGIINGDKKGY